MRNHVICEVRRNGMSAVSEGPSIDGLYYLCSENKGADQLRGYHAADLQL